MRRILLVDDDPDQLEIRKLIIHRAGHRVAIAANALDALTVFDAGRYDTVILDLRLPTAEEGLSLIRDLRRRSETVRLFVVSGWPADIERQPERHLVQEVMTKPVKSEGLLKKLAKFACLALALAVTPLNAAQATLELRAPREVVADLELSAPNSQWNRKGREGAYARVLVNGKLAAHIPVFLGGQPLVQSILLGHLPAGKHQITVERDPRTPNGIELKTGPIKVRTFAPGDPEHLMMAHAPILFARRDDLLFSDVPLLAYCERTRDRSSGRTTLEYTVIFSNEDGGTSTRALMARWGRTTDIEYVYRVTFDSAGKRLSGIIQTRGHADVEFAGDKEGHHPLLGVVTENNMVAPEGRSAIRWAPAPIPADLANASRELVMDQAPWTYRVASEELEREAKLRAFGTVDGQNISDPRHYLTFEARIAGRDARISPAVRLRTGPWRTAHLGRPDYAVERPGWARMSVELPPGTKPADIAELGFTCLTEPPSSRKPAPLAGACTVEAIGAVFLLNPDYTPGPSLWTRPLDSPVTLDSGQLVSLPWK
ncbi:MAG: response regulator [Bryobacterales bacterium]|nr:response regulator [Bryobacterales bacterium]